jgi:hypothetical protein
MNDLTPKPPIAPSVNGVDPKGAADHDSTTTPKYPQVTPQIEPTPKRKTESFYARPDPTPLWKILLEVVVGFAVICYTIAAYRQLETMHKTYGEIQKQTEQFTQQTTLLHDQLVGQQAAIVRAEARVWPTGQLSMLFTNVGHVIVKKPLTAEININRLRIDGTAIPNSETKFTCTIPVIGIGDAEAKYCEEPLFGALPRDKDLFKSTKIAIALDVRFQYDNGFGEIVKDSYCSYEFNKGQDWAVQTNAYVCDTNFRLADIPELQEAQKAQQ